MIIRVFIRLRELMITHRDLAQKLAEMEKKYDEQFQVVFSAIRQLITPLEKPKMKIGFRLPEK
jgi:hypothetical protein